MNIVGLLSSDDDISEMENIAKVFIVEQRLKYVSQEGKINIVSEKKLLQPIHKPSLPHPMPSQVFMVRGLN